MFGDLDFQILDDPAFKEDSVREELVVPILKRLGYSASGEHRILRTEPLEHPFVHIGTKPHKINIFPDYQLLAAGKKAWVLDAKAPDEDVRQGPNVEQAYSYAIHRDVRVPLYGLCNGRDLVVYHVSELEPKLAIPLTEIDGRWKEVHNLLSPLAFTNPNALHFLPDFGLSMLKMGLTNVETIFFPLLNVDMIAKARDDLYALVSNFEISEPYCAAFDADPEMYRQFLEAVSPKHRAEIRDSLSRHPWHHFFAENDKPRVTIGAVYAGYTVKNQNEQFVPLKIVQIRK
jgi:hypothetical protein